MVPDVDGSEGKCGIFAVTLIIGMSAEAKSRPQSPQPCLLHRLAFAAPPTQGPHVHTVSCPNELACCLAGMERSQTLSQNVNFADEELQSHDLTNARPPVQMEQAAAEDASTLSKDH